jgi:hypothetical protein
VGLQPASIYSFGLARDKDIPCCVSQARPCQVLITLTKGLPVTVHLINSQNNPNVQKIKWFMKPMRSLPSSQKSIEITTKQLNQSPYMYVYDIHFYFYLSIYAYVFHSDFFPLDFATKITFEIITSQITTTFPVCVIPL